MTQDALVRNRRRGLGVLLAIGLFAAGCGSGGSSNENAGSTASNASVDTSLMGTPNPATGTAVKVGVISNGRFATADRSYESDVAQATVTYLNKYKGGLGGRPIQLVTCIDQDSPAKSADCGNQMVKDNVVAVAIGSQALEDNLWEPLHAAHIPVVFYGASSQKVISDTTSTFDLSSPTVNLVDLPGSVAKAAGQKKVTVVVIDIPAAVTLYKTIGPALFMQYGATLNLVPIAPGTADMTPQMQKLATGDPGVVHVVGTDSFCISAFNGLRAVGFKGTVTTISQCLTAATLKAVPGSFLRGMKV
ncbi:MAG: ABC transporter substrate-binding protein, partial [Frankia sp.]